MCQQQQFDMSSQVEVLFENGMPRKLGKSVGRTLKKRAAAAAAAANNNNCCKNCNVCGGCSNPINHSTNRCTCDDLSVLSSSSMDEVSSKQLIHIINPRMDLTSSTEKDSDGSIADCQTGSIPSSNKTIRKGCPMAALLASRTVETSTESQSQTLSSSTRSTSSVPAPLTHPHTYREDILTLFTQLTKRCIQTFTQFCNKMQATKTYRVLSKSTQPAHVIAVGILSFVLLAVYPNLLENEEAALNANKKRSGLALVAYLGAFAIHFGAQIWMTFVSGLSLYFALPRHTFGLCQQILFPKYFAMNSMLSILTLILFIKVIAGRWEFSSYIQVIALTVCAVIEVTVRLYFAPPLLRLMREKTKFEVNMGSGQEVGTLEVGDLAKCPHYQGIHKAFRRIHMTVAMGNLTALVCTFLHLNYLAQKISF